jgi:polyisoprenyl-teichoic acid--peptidoglycan teichoic acid transferase
VTKRLLTVVSLFIALVTLVALVGGPVSSQPSGSVRVGKVHETFQPERGKIFILVIGNDARSGNPNNARADAIHLVGINTKTMRGGILNFPRDSWVPIPGRGSAKINESLYGAGPELVVRTIENLTRIRIDYYVMTGFLGFKGIIRKVGKIPMRIPFAIHDPSGSGANLRAGKQRLTAADSLAFVRTRHNFPRGDIDRTSNQGKFLISMLAELRRDVHGSPGTLMRWISAGRKFTRLDVPPDELFRLAVLSTQVEATRIKNVTVPVSIGSVGAASVVFISPAARKIYARFRRNASL